MAEIGRNDHIIFCVIYMTIILNGNTDTFRKGQVPEGLYIFMQQSYFKMVKMTRHGRFSIN